MDDPVPHRLNFGHVLHHTVLATGKRLDDQGNSYLMVLDWSFHQMVAFFSPPMFKKTPRQPYFLYQALSEHILFGHIEDLVLER